MCRAPGSVGERAQSAGQEPITYDWRRSRPDGGRRTDTLLREERDIAESCGYGFVVGVSTEEHKTALLREEPTLTVVVTGCKR